MDLYADLPLAKGAKASSALDADGKPKTALSSTNSVWASAPLMVPQAAKNKNSNRPTSMTISSTSMLPSALAAGRGKSPTLPAISLAFKPASVTRRTAAATQKKTEEEKVRPMGSGLGYVAATEVKVTTVQQREKEDVAAGANSAGGHFFQATYRDEYHPARPNSYEVYCKERLEKKKLDEVKRELSRRQREQEREGKLEREKLAKDLAEGRAPAMKLPAPAGRGRGMTMPAWMRKKIEDNAAAAQPESERDVDRERRSISVELNAAPTDGQFEDAAESRGAELNPQRRGDHQNRDRASSGRQQAHTPVLDEFGREIRHEPKRTHVDQRSDDHKDRRSSSSNYCDQDTGRDKGAETHSSSEKRRRTSGWDRRSPVKASLSTRVVLLKNMVGPGEVDDELQDEVKGECAETYGPVTKCMIYEVAERVPPEEAVRIFVQFRNAGDATKALTGLNGRFFGGRKVQAVYYDEGKFERMNLTSQ
ncbi:hypothetical protein KRP22_000795 [Phytophthora ramorum]|nr:DNA-damage-repair/toleration protein, chloroplastic [Phytophthora ramorum]